MANKYLKIEFFFYTNKDVANPLIVWDAFKSYIRVIIQNLKCYNIGNKELTVETFTTLRENIS